MKKRCDKGNFESIYEYGSFLEIIDDINASKYIKLAADNGYINMCLKINI